MREFPLLPSHMHSLSHYQHPGIHLLQPMILCWHMIVTLSPQLTLGSVPYIRWILRNVQSCERTIMVSQKEFYCSKMLVFCLLVSPSPGPLIISNFHYFLHNFAFSRTSYTWSHIVHLLFRFGDHSNSKKKHNQVLPSELSSHLIRQNQIPCHP
jgi:hypothetical protein